MPRHERDRRPGERVADEDHVVLRVGQCVGDELGVPRQPRGRVFHRQVDATARWPRASSSGTSRSQHHAPCQEPCTRPNVAIRDLRYGRGASRQVAEDEVPLAVRDMVEGHRGQRLDERHPVGRVELVLDAAVDDAEVARRASRACRRRSSSSPTRRGSASPARCGRGCAVRPSSRARRSRARGTPGRRRPPGARPPETGGDGAPGRRGIRTAIPPSRRDVEACIPLLRDGVHRELRVEHDRLARARRRRRGLASSARSTFSGVIGSSVTQTPTAS